MKNIFSILAIAVLAFTITSCQKVRTTNDILTVNETYEAQINNNASYTFHLPNNEFVITEDALNAEISIIDTENNIYSYTPTEGFVGSEVIKLSTINSTGFCGTADVNNTRCGSDKREQKTLYYYTINLTVNNVSK